MASPSPILQTREMTTGGDVNLWGGYLITTERTAERAIRGYEGYTVTGDATISWTNYSATNSFAAMFTKMAGSPSAAFTITLPSYQTFQAVSNAAGQTGTIKNSGGTGVAIPTGRKSLLYGDGTDIYEASPNWLSSYATTLTNAGDIVVKTTLETAIANASLPASAGTVLVSAADTTAGYIGTKITGSGAASVSTSGLPGNGSLVISVGALGLSDGGTISGAGAVVVNTKYLCDFTASSYTITLPAAPTAGDMILLTKYGTYAMTLDLNGLKFNGSTTNPVSADEGQTLLRYTGASRGWVEM